MNTIFDHALWVSPLFWTLMLLGVAIILFVHNKIRMDVVALLVMLSFYLSGILSIQEILVGFSDPNIILIALLFIVGESLVRTGIAYRVSDGILKVAGNSEAKVLILLMLSVAGLGAFMSSTGVVAVFIPVVMMICRQMNISSKRLMMPLSVAGLISGMMTLGLMLQLITIDNNTASLQLRYTPGKVVFNGQEMSEEEFMSRAGRFVH